MSGKALAVACERLPASARSSHEYPETRLFSVASVHISMRDIVSALVSGVVGTAVIVVLLYLGDALTGFTLDPFGPLSRFVGESSGPLVGFLLFAAIGVFAWPFLFLTLVEYLPGDADVVRGLLFGVVLWIGFVVAFAPALGVASLLLYLVVTLVAHLAYGLVLGGVYQRFAERDVTGVSRTAV